MEREEPNAQAEQDDDLQARASELLERIKEDTMTAMARTLEARYHDELVDALEAGDLRAAELALEKYTNIVEITIQRRLARVRLADDVDTLTPTVSEGMPTISLLIHQHSPIDELAALERGLPAAAWRSLEYAGYSHDEISAVVGNSPKTIRRKQKRDEPLDLAEGDRTMRLMRITVEAAEVFGNQKKALSWMRRPNAALHGKTPLEMLVTETGTALVRRSIGVIAYGGVA